MEFNSAVMVELTLLISLPCLFLSPEQAPSPQPIKGAQKKSADVEEFQPLHMVRPFQLVIHLHSQVLVAADNLNHCAFSGDRRWCRSLCSNTISLALEMLSPR